MSGLYSVPETRRTPWEVGADEDLGEVAPCGYLTTSMNGLITSVNDTFLGWTGYRRHELVGQFRLVDLLTAGGKIYHETHFAPALQMQGSMQEIALEVVRKNGSKLPVLLNAVLSRDVATQSTEIRIAVFDATDRRSYERELLRAKVRAEEAENRVSALARTLQATLIPPTPPHIEGLEVAAVYRPGGDGEEVGGDFYDVFQIDDDTWVVTLGDVCGSGVEAAVVTALVRYTLRAVSMQTQSPAEALLALNDVLLRHESDRFATVVLLRLRRTADTWVGTISNGGHPLALLRDDQGVVRDVGEPGTLTGAVTEVSFTDVDLVLNPGEQLVLYTDGVLEARSAHGLYGEDRLRAAVTALGPSPESVVEGVLGNVLRFSQGTSLDDIAVVSVAVPDAELR